MKKNTFTILVALALALFLSGCIPQLKKQSTEEGEAGGQEQAPQIKEEEEENYSGSLEKMMGLGIPLKCEWRKDENYHGVSFVKGKNSASEISMADKTANVIFKDNCLWSWETGNPQGFKMCLEEGKKPEVEGQEMDMGDMRPPDDVDYNCRPAVFTDAKFNPPSEVNFMSMEEMMKGAMEE